MASPLLTEVSSIHSPVDACAPAAPPANDLEARLSHILTLQGSQEDQAGVAVFEWVRSSLDTNRTDAPCTVEIIRTLTDQIELFSSPRLLVNVLMATYPLRSTLGDDRHRLVTAVEAQLRLLLGDERTSALVGRLR